MNEPVSAGPGKSLAAILILLLWPQVQTFAGGGAPLKAAPVKSAPVTLAWNPAEDPTVKGYGIYYGLANLPATNHVDAGTNLTVTLFNLLADTSYRIYAVSYNAAGDESVPSNELLLTPQVLSPVRIARLVDGEVRLTLRAAPGSVCQVEYADTPDDGTWQVFGLAVADAMGEVAVIDPALPQPSSRFYRVARLGNPTIESPKLASPGNSWDLQ